MAVKRVLMVHNYYQQGGGEHTVFENEIRLLQEHGVEVFAYTKDNKDLKRYPWRLLLLPFSTIWSFSSYLKVKKLIRKNQIDLVHCHNTFPQISPSVYYAAWGCGVPVVQTIHNFRFVCPNGLCFRNGHVCEECLHSGMFNALRHGCYRGSRLQTLPVVLMLAIHRCLGTYKKLPCLFLTQFSKNKIAPRLSMPGENIFVRGNFVQKSEKSGLQTYIPNRFVYVGRLDEYKGVVQMLERFADHPELELVICGDGALRSRVEKMACRCANIMFRKQCPHEVVLQEMRSSAALIFPSLLYEGFPMTIAESFSQGVPVLCSNIGNGAQLVEETGGGVLYDPQNADAFDAAVTILIQNREVLAENARRAAEQWGPEPSWQALKNIYEEIVRHGSEG